jgi:hypothetical protein
MSEFAITGRPAGQSSLASSGAYDAGMSETWVARLTYADGQTEDVEFTPDESGSCVTVIPEGLTSTGPIWRKGERPPDPGAGFRTEERAGAPGLITAV